MQEPKSITLPCDASEMPASQVSLILLAAVFGSVGGVLHESAKLNHFFTTRITIMSVTTKLSLLISQHWFEFCVGRTLLATTTEQQHCKRQQVNTKLQSSHKTICCFEVSSINI